MGISGMARIHALLCPFGRTFVFRQWVVVHKPWRNIYVRTSLCSASSDARAQARAEDFRVMAEELAGKEYSSKYLDSLRARVDPEQAVKEVEQELYAEMGASLGRAADKIN